MDQHMACTYILIMFKAWEHVLLTSTVLASFCTLQVVLSASADKARVQCPHDVQVVCR
jgi:hypothetical protein